MESIVALNVTFILEITILNFIVAGCQFSINTSCPFKTSLDQFLLFPAHAAYA